VSAKNSPSDDIKRIPEKTDDSKLDAKAGEFEDKYKEEQDRHKKTISQQKKTNFALSYACCFFLLLYITKGSHLEEPIAIIGILIFLYMLASWSHFAIAKILKLFIISLHDKFFGNPNKRQEIKDEYEE